MSMPLPNSLARAVAALPLCAVAVAAQPPASGARPAPRPLGAVVATSTDLVGAVAGMRPLPGGRALVNDPARRQVVLLDAAMAAPTVVADTTPRTGNAYSGRFGGLVPYRGDSTLFVDPQSLSMLVIDGAGGLGRTMSVPSTQEAAFLAGAQMPSGWDPAGRIIYRGMNFPRTRPTPGQPFRMPELPDSAPVQRIALATRTVDTVAFFKVPKPSMQVTQTEGRVTMTSKVNPIPLVDDWAPLPNGDVAVIRGRDYSVEFHRADGRIERGPKVPFTWRRLTDDEKVAFLDSVKAARERMPAATVEAGTPRMTMSFSSGPGGGPPAGLPPMAAGGGQQIVMIAGPAEGMRGGAGAVAGEPPAGGAARPQLAPPQVTFVDPSELPDYLPPFAQNSTRADPDGRLWVRLALPTPAGTGPLYDVLDGRGVLVDHVQLPAGRTLAGFGTDGTVYLQSRTEDNAVRLEKVKLR